MGEKIRDIRPVNLIGNDLMAELNEGYTKSQGRVIHIQNSKFRYLLTEKDFLKVSSDIMRANEELKYIKTHLPSKDIKIPKYAGECTPLENYALLAGLEKSDVTYRILENRDRLITILIKPDDRGKFKKLFKKEGAKAIEHPYGKRHGFVFLYKMHAFEMYSKDGLYYEIMYELPCKSSTPKMWMPLDKCVQKSLWENENRVNGFSYVTDEDIWIFRMMRCLVMQKSFTDADVEFFTSHASVLESSTLKDKLKLVVFAFSDTLTELVRNGQYDRLVEAYYSYNEY